MFRKFLAILLMFFFAPLTVLFESANLANSTVLNGQFYAQDINQKAYRLLVGITANIIHENSEIVNSVFKIEQIEQEIEQVYTKNMFDQQMQNFANDLNNYIDGESNVLSFDLTNLKRSLLTVFNNLSYEIYNKLPTCASENADVFSEAGLPTCVVRSANYDLIVAPINRNLENILNNNIPDSLDNLESLYVADFVRMIDTYIYGMFVFLILIIIAIALLVYKPFYLISRYLAANFIISAIVLAVIGFNLPFLLGYLQIQADTEGIQFYLRDFLNFLMDNFANQYVQAAGIYGILGVGLLVISIVLKRTIDNKLA